MDLIVFASCRIISIDDKDYGRKELCDLEKWGVNDDCHTIVRYDDEQVLRDILEIMDPQKEH